MAAFFLLFHNERALSRERVFRDRSSDLDSLGDQALIARYRFPRESIMNITDLVRDLIERPTLRSYAIPAHIQVMTTLRLLAKGDYLSEAADTNGISIASASRVFHSVCGAICQKVSVEFPMGEQEKISTKQKFYNISGFPNVLGAIDGTLIPIQGMSGNDEPSYVCRKQFHAINVQGIADADLRFINIVVRWPGSTHDAFILNNSHIPEIMETVNEGWLLGDSGCLHKTGGALQFSPARNCKIIGACFRLHNIAINERIPLLECGQIQLENNETVLPVDNNTQAFAIRRRLINRF